MITFFSTIWAWILSIPTKIEAAIDFLISKLEIFFYDFLTSMINFSSSTIDGFLGSSSFTQQFENNYLGLSLDTRYAVEALNIPEAILIVISAYALRFAIKLIPGV